VTNLTPKDTTIGYCTNVHAGIDLDSIRNSLRQYSVTARKSVGADELGVGLWLPARAAGQLAAGEVAAFAEFLRENHLRAYTINGFPYDNFHDPVVKHRVYQPTWWQQERLQYTKQLADVLAVLLPEPESTGSISTLPLGWPLESESSTERTRLWELAGANLRDMADHLRRVEAETGQRIVVAIEPEPGCVLDSTDDVIRLFAEQLPEPNHRRYITVCHDICHSAVMMERQSDVIARLMTAGIGIGKVQVSSAIVADWDAMAVPRRREAIDQLRQFAEDRYLHQTGRLTDRGGFELAEDLPSLIAKVPAKGDPVGGDKKWVVHFHVPIFLERFGHLSTSQGDVLECLQAIRASQVMFTGHLEIETYAWTVLPASMRQRGLAEDIASEIKWLQKTLLAIL
jgi:sugar phosphate isomerase/epimerase